MKNKAEDKKKRVVLPVETKVRELDGKLWLARNLAQQGFKIAVGELSAIKKNIKLLHPHIYIGDSAVYRDSRYHLYKQLHSAGTKVVVQDTEGGIFYSPEMYLKRLSPKILQYVDLYLSWGQAAADIFLANLKDVKTKIEVTGNPTFDLLNPELREYFTRESQTIKERYGDFILINTKFGRVNHFNKKIDPKRLLYNDPEIEKFQNELFDYFVEAILALSDKFNKINFVIRPHPSEDHNTYHSYFAEKNNVFIEHWWSVHPWALASMGVIHNGCTTGIESVLLDKPVFSYRPIKNEKVDIFLPNHISRQIFTLEELLVEVEKTALSPERQGGNLNQEQIECLERHFHLLDGKAAFRMGESINNITGKSDICFENSAGCEVQNKLSHMRKLKSLSGKLLGRIARKDNSIVRRYGKQKFSSLSLEEMFERCQRVDQCFKKTMKLKIDPIPEVENSFWLSRDEEVT